MAAPAASIPGIYTQWLCNALDLSIPSVSKTLDFLDRFEGLQYKNESIYYEYARNWCVLSSFLFNNKERQLCSSNKVKIWFEVPEKRNAVDVYWFEVVRACDLLATATMHTLVRDLDLVPASLPSCYALHSLALPAARCAELLASLKRTIGVCSFVLQVAAVKCVYLRLTCPKALDSITRRYNTFRVVACWLYARHQLVVETKWSLALSAFATCEALGAVLDTTPAAVPLYQSLKLLQTYTLVHQSMQSLHRGVAQAHLRKGKLQIVNPTAAECKPLLDVLEVLVATTPGAIPPAIPADDSPLLMFKADVNMKMFEAGTSPCLGQQALVCRG